MGRKKETIIAKLENVLTKITAKIPLYFSPFEHGSDTSSFGFN